jgi:hypothetical protein
MRALLVLVVLLASASPVAAKRVACMPGIGPAPVAAKDDLIAPAAVVHGVRIDGHAIWIEGDFGPDTSRLHITYKVGDQTVELWTKPEHRYVCTPEKMPDGTLVSVAAIDESGNASSSVTSAYGRPRYRCGLSMIVLVVPGLTVFSLLILLLVRWAIRHHKLKQPGIALSPLAAESMVRATIDHLHIVIVCSLALVLALYFTGDVEYAAMVGWLPVTRLIRLAIARRFLGRLDNEAPVVLHDNLIATFGRYIIVPSGIAHSADQRGVPSARRVRLISRGSNAPIDEAPAKP